MGKPVLFIGSAKESLEIVDALEASLLNDVRVKRWDIDAVRVGEFSLNGLLRNVATSDFAVFVLGQDDKTDSRGKVQPSPRDNVIFEGGLFASALGLERTLFLVDSRGTKRPSDWDGLGYLTYDVELEEPRQRVLQAVTAIRKRIQEKGARDADNPANLIQGDWWQLVLNSDEGSVLSHMSIDVTGVDTVKVSGESWSSEGKVDASYSSRAATYRPGDQTLCYYWEGDHQREEGLPKYFGVGEIKFDFPKKDARFGRGRFTSTNSAAGPDGLFKTSIRRCFYFPAPADDLAVLDDPSNVKQRHELTQKLLAKRKEMME